MKNKLPDYLLSGGSDTAVLFIHGLGGSHKTWNKFSHTLSATWQGEESFSLEYDEYYADSYNIPFLSFIYKSITGSNIEDLAKHLKSIINTVCKKYKNVILVCHSMGGLIARKFIINELKSEKTLGNIKGLITYATPHHGSKLANIAKAIFHDTTAAMLYLRKFLQIRDLSYNSDFINELNHDWSIFNVNNKLKFLRVVGLADAIVSVESAELASDRNVFTFANKGHFSIIKPHKLIKDGALMVTHNFLQDFRKDLEKQELLEMEYEEEDKYEY